MPSGVLCVQGQGDEQGDDGLGDDARDENGGYVLHGELPICALVTLLLLFLLSQ